VDRPGRFVDVAQDPVGNEAATPILANRLANGAVLDALTEGLVDPLRRALKQLFELDSEFTADFHDSVKFFSTLRQFSSLPKQQWPPN